MMSERMTTIVSALVALAILGLGVTAQPTGDPTNGRIEALESDLRFQIEMSWRHDGKIRDLREIQLAETLAAWKASPQTGPDRQLLEKWLRASIVGTLPGESGEFPPTPTFSTRTVEAEKPAPAADAVAKSPPRPPVVEAPQNPQPTAPADSNNAPSSTPRDVRLKPGQAYTPPKAKEFRIPPRTPAAGQAAVEPKTQAPQTPAPKRVVAAKPIEAAPPAPTPPPEQMIEREQPRVAEKTPAVVREDQQPKVVAPAVAASPSGPVVVEPKTETPTVAASSNPTTLKPAIVNQPTPSNQPVPERESPALLEENSITPVTVNLAELNAQIRGYHDGLHEIDSIVVAKDGNLTEGDVAKLVGQLEQLAAQYQFVRLYYDGLSKGERRFVAAPRSMGETIDLVEAQRAALMAEEEDFLTALEGAVAEDELAQRLKAIAAEVGADDVNLSPSKSTP